MILPCLQASSSDCKTGELLPDFIEGNDCMIKIAVMGFGTVGSGVLEVISKNANSIETKAGKRIEVKYILDIRDFEGSPYEGLFTKKFEDILNDDEIKVVVEVIGGLEPAYNFTKQLLEKGKHVVTSNKELVATYGTELLSIAKEKNINYLFEASVGGGIPIIRPLNNCLAANEISEIVGILNGTTNYILSQMIKEGNSFEAALSDAQAKGYAEKNSEADIEGHDACRKIAILSSLVFGKYVDYRKIYTEGITKIRLQDVSYISRMGCVVKLLAVSRRKGDKVLARVSPAIISKEHPLSSVEDVFNGILVKGDAIGDVMFYGRGAGKLPTASAVIADIIDIVRNLGKNINYFWEESGEDYVLDYREDELSYYIRVRIGDKSLAMTEINHIVGECHFILIENAKSDELAFITPFKKERVLIEDVENIRKLGMVKEIVSVIRKIEEEV